MRHLTASFAIIAFFASALACACPPDTLDLDTVGHDQHAMHGADHDGEKTDCCESCDAIQASTHHELPLLAIDSRVQDIDPDVEEAASFHEFLQDVQRRPETGSPGSRRSNLPIPMTPVTRKDCMRD